MKVLCAVKRVVDPDVKVSLTGSGELDTSNVEYKLNPFDEYGVEEAIRLKEAGTASEVIAVCVGGEEAEKEIRTALAMGADRAVRVDADENEIDTLTVAKAMAAVAQREDAQLFVLGKLSVDTEGNQVGQMIAEVLGWGQGTFAYSLEVEGGAATVGREVDGGTSKVKLQLPAVITADLRLNEPRYASLPGIMKAKKKQLDVLSLDDLGVEATNHVRTLGYELPPERGAGEIVDDVATLVSKLKNEAKVI